MKSDQELVEAVAQALYERDQCARAQGISVDEVKPGYSRLSMVVRDNMVNGHAICHGGMTFTLADTALAYASNTSNHTTVALSAEIVFLSPARLGDVLTATCRETYQKDRAGVYDVVVTAQSGATVALYRGQARRVQGKVV